MKSQTASFNPTTDGAAWEAGTRQETFPQAGGRMMESGSRGRAIRGQAMNGFRLGAPFQPPFLSFAILEF